MPDERNWTSFNSGKLFYHIDRWKQISPNAPCPPPALITVDPSNTCNLSCEWCNAWKVRKNQRQLSRQTLLNAADYFAQWTSTDKRYRVGSVCIAGGGEPLTNPYVGEFLERLYSHKIKCATVSNGLLLDRFFDPLLYNEYVALSVDAGTAKTFNKYKGLPPTSSAFNKIIHNIEELCKLSRSKKCPLNTDSPSNGVNYRMLIYKDNIQEIFEAAKIVQELGCKNFHIRPASVPFDGQISFSYSKEELEEFHHQVELVNTMPNRKFGFYYTLGKFDEHFNKKNDFCQCYGLFMTATLMPPNQAGYPNGYCLNLCCDRRSDPQVRLITNSEDIADIGKLWGSEKHWQIFKSITPQEIQQRCPRCTYYAHNKIYENCIADNKDNLLLDFI